jgi:hypothetical protein
MCQRTGQHLRVCGTSTNGRGDTEILDTIGDANICGTATVLLFDQIWSSSIMSDANGYSSNDYTSIKACDLDLSLSIVELKT